MGGAVLNIIGTIPFLWMTGGKEVGDVSGRITFALLSFALLARGIGQGATGIPAIAAAYASVPKDKLGLATTAINIVQRLGGPLATTALALVVATTTTGMATLTVNGPSKGTGFFAPFLALAFLQILGLVSASRLPFRIHQHESTSH